MQQPAVQCGGTYKKRFDNDSERVGSKNERRTFYYHLIGNFLNTQQGLVKKDVELNKELAKKDELLKFFKEELQKKENELQSEKK